MGKIAPFDSVIGFLFPGATPEPEKEKAGKKPTRQKKRGNKLLVISIIVFVLLVVGGIGGYLLFFPEEPSYTPRFPDDFNWVDISPGTFIMGNSNSSNLAEKPAHQVTISKGFQMLSFEVTQAQWETVMGKWDLDPHKSHRKFGVGDNHPIYAVSWKDCQSFISRLNKLDSNYTYRLPTEAEWEYCCRAGSETDFYFGDDIDQMDQYAWYGLNSRKPHPVGKKLPNAWGLYDMHGNVKEWCQDYYNEDYYENSPDTDPQGPDLGVDRAYRSSVWEEYHIHSLHSSRRNGLSPDVRSTDNGLRLVREEA